MVSPPTQAMPSRIIESSGTLCLDKRISSLHAAIEATVTEYLAFSSISHPSVWHPCIISPKGSRATGARLTPFNSPLPKAVKSPVAKAATPTSALVPPTSPPTKPPLPLPHVLDGRLACRLFALPLCTLSNDLSVLALVAEERLLLVPAGPHSVRRLSRLWSLVSHHCLFHSALTPSLHHCLFRPLCVVACAALRSL